MAVGVGAGVSAQAAGWTTPQSSAVAVLVTRRGTARRGIRLRPRTVLSTCTRFLERRNENAPRARGRKVREDRPPRQGQGTATFVIEQQAAAARRSCEYPQSRTIFGAKAGCALVSAVFVLAESLSTMQLNNIHL